MVSTIQQVDNLGSVFSFPAGGGVAQDLFSLTVLLKLGERGVVIQGVGGLALDMGVVAAG